MADNMRKEGGDVPARGEPAPRCKWRLFLAVLAMLVAVCPAVAADAPQITAVRAGFAGRYKVGANTLLQVTVHGGEKPADLRVRATAADSDGLNCTFDAAGPGNLSRGQDATVPLCVRFGREANPLTVELFEGDAVRAAKTFASAASPSADQIPNALRPGQRLIVAVGAAAGNMDNALPSSEGKLPRNAVATVENLADMPDCWQGYEGVDFVILCTSRREFLAQIAAQPSRIEALDQWVRMGGTLVLSAGERAEEAIGKTSPLARFVPGRYDSMAHLHAEQAAVWETLANGHTSIPAAKSGERLDLPTPRLAADVRGRVEARSADIPLVVRAAHGFGEVIFVATDLDGASLRAWGDRPLLLAALLGLPGNEPPVELNNAVESYGYDDLAGQLRSSLELFRDVRLAPFFVVASLVVLYILLIGPGDYFLLRRLGCGMHWTWVTFPVVVVVFVVDGYWASSWLKRDELRVNQVDLIDIDADGTARGTSWFGIFSPRAETYDLSLRPSLPNGGQPQKTIASLGWFGKAGSGFNGMYNRDAQGVTPLGGDGYSIGRSMDSARGVPVQTWSCKNFVYRWLGSAGNQGVSFALQEENHQPSGTITNHLERETGKGIRGVTLTHAYLACDGWAYLLGTIRPGETVPIDPSTRRVSLNTYLSSESIESNPDQGGQSDKAPYDAGNRDPSYVLRAMLFYDAAGGRKRTGMANDYQGQTDLSGVFRTGRAVLVAVPLEEEDCTGASVLFGPAPESGQPDTRLPLSGPLDKHTTIYRFVVPVGKQ